MKLNLLSIGTNAKTSKSDKLHPEYLTAILYLSPGAPSICPFAEKAGCKAACLNTAGRGKLSNVQLARQRKTKLWLEDRPQFLKLLNDDIIKVIKYCDKNRRKACFRLNGTSDIQWERHIQMEDYSEAQFYDYTKLPKSRKLPINYHLTFSYSGATPEYGARSLANGMSTSVVFRNGPFPKFFLGYPVFNGDSHDLRFLDPPGHVIGLSAKGRAKHDYSGFVVDVI